MHKTLQSIATVALLLNAVSCVTTTGGTSGAQAYPLKTCIVTDNDLGSMGDERTIVHEGREIKFCCEPCVGKFEKNPAKYLAKLAP
jgi:hypothetical protein